MVKHVVIFGSTGVTGLCVTKIAFTKGLKTRAFLRDPKRLPNELCNCVDIVQGDVLNYTSVVQGVKGTDSVIVTLGTRSDLTATTVMSDGLKNIITAMKANNVKVLSVCLSAFLFFDIESDAVPDRLKEVTKEHRRMYDALKESDLDYIAVFPPHISQEDGSGYIVKNDQYVGRMVSKFDLAQFLVDCLDDKQYFKKTIGIASMCHKKL